MILKVFSDLNDSKKQVFYFLIFKLKANYFDFGSENSQPFEFCNEFFVVGQCFFVVRSSWFMPSIQYL